MTKHHYVYHSYEEWGRDYIGIRSCDCLPEEDTKYFGSFKDKTFKPTEKTILFVCETRKEAGEIEIKLHDFFDVAVNPQFANRSKQTSTKFDTTGVPRTEEDKRKISETMSGENHHQFGVPKSEEQRKKQSVAMLGKNVGKTLTEEHKKKLSVGMSGENNPNYGRFGALNHSSKAIIAIQPDGTELHFGSGCEAARKLEINQGSLCGLYLKIGHVPTKGKFKGWQFLFKNSENF